MAQFLFVSSPLQGLFKSMESNADMAIHNLSDDTLLSQSVETLVQRIFDENSIKVPTLDLNSVCRTYTDASVPQAPVPNPMYDSQPRVPGRIHTLHIPYAGPEHMFHYMPMVPSPNKILGDTTSLEVTIDVGGVWLSADDIDKQFDDAIATIEDSLSRLRKDVEPFNKGLPGRIRASAERRRQAAEQTRQTTQAIKYPLRQVGNAPQTYRLPERPPA